MLLRNLSPSQGLCNGTRLIIKSISNRLLVAKITIGEFKDKIVFLPRLPLIPSDSGLPFDMQRIQFPIRPAFAMTINKSQGQSLNFAGIWLEEPVFAHGQLYVALSRVSGWNNVAVHIPKQSCRTTNVVFKEIFDRV